MSRQSNHRAITGVWLLAALVVAYGCAQFILPVTSETSGGLLGIQTIYVPVFNWQLFILVFTGCVLPIAILQFFQGQRMKGVLLLAWLIISSVGLWILAMIFFEVKDIQNGFLGLSSTETYEFDEGTFLIAVATLISLWLLAEGFRPGIPGGKGLRLILLLATGISLACFLKGLHAPAFWSQKFFLWKEETSLVESIRVFINDGEIFLTVVLLLFTLFFPFIKYMYIIWSLQSEPGKKNVRLYKSLSFFSKWSMLDVFVIALVIVNMKWDSEIITMELRYGVILFAVSIILQTLVMMLTPGVYEDRKAEKGDPGEP